MLLHRRLTDPRIRATSRTSDIALLVLLWVQLVLGLATIPLSAQHLDGGMMLQAGRMGAAHRDLPRRRARAARRSRLGVQGPHVPGHDACSWSSRSRRLVHVWSGFATLAYVFRPYQVVRTRRAIRKGSPVQAQPAGAEAPAFEPQHRSAT